MNNNFSIKNRLADWGQKSQQLPANNTTMKEEIMAAARPVAGASKPAKRYRPWLYRAGILAVSAVAIVLVITGPDLLAKRTSFGISVGGSGSVAQRDFAVSTNMADVDYSSSELESDGPISVDSLSISYGEATGLGSETGAIRTIASKAAYEISGGEEIANPILYTSAPAPTFDARELMETQYGATIKTRNVNKIATQAQTIIRGQGGRMNNLSIQEKYAYISFSLPKEKFDQMMVQLKDLVPKKMYEETISAYNRLSEKQSIETNTENIKTELVKLQTEKEELTATHETKSAEIQNRIDASTALLNTQYKLKAATRDQIQLSKINDEINRLTAEKKSAETELKTLNTRYDIDLKRIERNIERQNTTLDNLDVQNENLDMQVETVSGTINIQHVSIWEIIKIYVPVKPLAVGLIVLAAVYLLFFKGRNRKVEVPV